MARKIVVVDYCKGNLQSVLRGLTSAGGEAFISSDPAEIKKADAVVLPGVGAFSDASAYLESSGQMSVIRAMIEAEKPFLGICLGLHLLFSEGEEGSECQASVTDNRGQAHGQGEAEQNYPLGLGVCEGRVVRLPLCDTQGVRYKVPHVGWDTVTQMPGCSSKLLQGIADNEYFYFTHSYAAPMTDTCVAHTAYSCDIPSVVEKEGRIFGVQFHPEKSSDTGCKLLSNFVRVVEEA